MERHEGAGGEGLYQARIFPIPFLNNAWLQEAISHKYKVFLADLAGLFLLGHLEIKFIKEHIVSLARGSLRAFLLRIHEKILPSSVEQHKFAAKKFWA